MEPYRTFYPDAARRLPYTEAVAAKLLILPTGTGVAPEDVRRLCELLELMVAQGPALHARIASSRPAT